MVNAIPNPGGHLPLYLLIAGVVAVMLLARRVPFIGRLLSFAMTAGSIVLVLVILSERAQFDPMFARMAQRFQLGQQQAVGRETHVRMSPDGHFWVRVKIGDMEKRMLVDSGATVTALSADTAAAAGIEAGDAVMPVLMQTANGTVKAKTATVAEMRIGNVVARNVPVVVSPAFGDMNVVGMNFLSRLKSWRVEDGVLILQPHHPQGVS
ncbi:TIGR02281 family clan AA aspartic protease [Sphingomonas sp. TREG-RG-20F-R18-01]|uniref:retropepsin-like aspartic protease family protein n=1 Tax=Sphingomonas sp. TREG-RG-20F-R18-01 TaxID=2914982 RepID=UPI001F5A90BE|nr:TIGR02281 family clan AA aspartic protease [Sphingomonas sp. TREG-RG-20F-R18-01]